MAVDHAVLSSSKNEIATELPWFVAYTKPAQEELAQTNLLRQGYRVYLPRVKRLQSRKFRKTSLQFSFEPMFPRYIFFQVAHAEQSISPVRSSIGISKLVQFGNEAACLSDSALLKIQELEIHQNDLGVEELSGLKPGKKVMVDEGPFAGIIGLISEVSKERVIVLMQLLGREMRVGFNIAQLMLAA